jgi:hypothetical protein
LLDVILCNVSRRVFSSIGVDARTTKHSLDKETPECGMKDCSMSNVGDSLLRGVDEVVNVCVVIWDSTVLFRMNFTM